LGREKKMKKQKKSKVGQKESVGRIPTPNVIPFIHLYFTHLLKARRLLKASISNYNLTKKTKNKWKRFKVKYTGGKEIKKRDTDARILLGFISRHEENLSKMLDYFVNVDTGAQLLKRIDCKEIHNKMIPNTSSRAKKTPTFPNLMACLKLARKEPYLWNACGRLENHNDYLQMLFVSYEFEYDYNGRVFGN